jgi:ATP-binding cassette, subfamily B, bacterial MsbA
MPTVLTLLGFIRPFAWTLPALVVLGLASSLAEGIGIGLLIPLLNVFLQDQPSTAGGAVEWLETIGSGLGREARLILLSGCILGLVILKSAIISAFFGLSAWVNGQVSHRLRTALFRQLLGVGYAFIVSNDAGRLANTLETETDRTSSALAALASLTISACAVLAFVALLVLLSWQLTLVVLGGAVPLSLLVRFVARRAHRLGHNLVEASAEASKRVWETLSAMRLIRVSGQEEREQARFDAASDALRAATVRMELVNDLTRPILEPLYVPVFLACILYAWYAEIGVATVLTFLLLAYRLQPYIKTLDGSRIRLATYAAAVQDVASMLDERGKPYIRSGSRPFTGLHEDIIFDRVSFAYGGAHADKPAVRDVSFRIDKGSIMALIGPSGAGKSTLINLLCRLYDPTAGEIRVDGTPLRDFDLATWRSRLGLAGQDLDLVTGTVRDNIAYGCPNADDVAVIAAARRADAHGFIEALPAGYATTVGDRGVRLSGGQRQRIGLARALLRNPDVLILDEATNALDSLSEAEIQRVLGELAGRLTMVIIAHRMSTIRNADRVVVLGDGRVIEEGHPTELFRAQGPFAHFYEFQAAALSGRSGV